jgi:simple sugar transport system substrate-binding protein
MVCLFLQGERHTLNEIDYIAVPELLRRLNWFARGVQEVNPDATIKVVWINSWYDPPKETEAAESLIAAGADVVQHLSSSPASLQAAQAAGVYSIGYQNDLVWARKWRVGC